MSEVSSKPRGEQADSQTVLVTSAQRTTASNQNQQRSSSQAERSERSERSGRGDRTGRGERHRIARSSSSTSSSDSSLHRTGRTAGRVDGQNIPTGQQHYLGDQGYYAGASNGASIVSMGSGISGERRQGRLRRQVIRLPDQAQGQVRQVRHRLPTPEPDTLERVYIQRTAGEVVEEITEIPTTPPPRVQERTVVEPAGPPQVVKRVIRVPPRGGSYGNYQQQQQQQQGNTAVLGTGNYGSIQQAGDVYQQQANTGSYQQYSGGAPAVNTGASYSSGYGPVAGGYQQQQQQQQQQPQQQQGYGYPSNTGGYSSQQVSPPAGCHPAFCFYV